MIRMKNIIGRYLQRVATILMLLLIVLAAIILVVREQQSVCISSRSMFIQVEHILNENAKELAMAKENYSRMCLNNAEAIAYIIQGDPSVLDSIEDLKYIAEMVGVDEIHLFNKDGVIFNGTHPEYYNMSVEDGEQIGFFKQMLEDKSRKLVQEILPNTAEGKYMQYSAVWSPNGEFIVQVGMNQENVLSITEKNNLSNIFFLLRTSENVNLYAVDRQTGIIMGTTEERNQGKKLEDIGIDAEKGLTKGCYAFSNGELVFCVFTEYEDMYLGRTIRFYDMYKNVFNALIALILGVIITDIVLVYCIMRFMNKEVITRVGSINDKLFEISAGNLDEHVEVHSCIEFSELSNGINNMIKSLLESTSKISYVLDKADVQIGVYEYSEKMKTVRITEKASKILNLSEEKSRELSEDCVLFKKYLGETIFEKIEDDNIYRICGDNSKYVRYEELSFRDSILGIIIDITEDYNRRRQLEIDSDIDVLTGLLNRRGLEKRMETLFQYPKQLGFGAVVMIDGDGLKQVNDRLGHEAGDDYIKGIAENLKSFDAKKSICSRQGGDEFVLLFYHFENDDEVREQIRLLDALRGSRTVTACGETISVEFSFGVSMLDGSDDYSILLKRADEKMYENKKERKRMRLEEMC